MQEKKDKYSATTYEKMWGKNLKHLPHYYLVAQPMYCKFGGKDAPLVSVPLTFFMMDYLFHQLFPRAAIFGCPRNAFFKPNIPQSLFWVSLSIPIAITKELRRHNTICNKEEVVENPKPSGCPST
ncbi:TPA: hypothetical protein I8Y81_003191 [Legionella pneumophila]|nr:hypothetical protein [Legionella pneumophila]HAT1658407.1 hypothetical protein [Legionella pneumophila]HAT1660776.1 hypothetical protein [Legionella pneumophila]HAT1883600.1 hypothetical protein [Legionella pneumophila]HAT1884530.1 hypothetical protein [Legionella pneumophila]HAT2115320.1 hypothetical protein [Legionella pneumophila]